MTEKRANEIFRTKYPEGEIVRRNNSSAGNKFWVTFKPTGKVYYYSCSTYQELLSRFGFEIVYQHNIDSVKGFIKYYEKQLEEKRNGVFDNPFVLEYTEEIKEQEMQDTLSEIKKWKALLKHYKEDCIID